MADSFLGVVTRRGLELLVRETEHAERFLQRRLRRGRGAHQAVCCWAVLSEPAACAVRRELGSGRYWSALVLLNAEARALGTLLPEATEDDLFMHV